MSDIYYSQLFVYTSSYEGNSIEHIFYLATDVTNGFVFVFETREKNSTQMHTNYFGMLFNRVVPQSNEAIFI